MWNPSSAWWFQGDQALRLGHYAPLYDENVVFGAEKTTLNVVLFNCFTDF